MTDQPLEERPDPATVYNFAGYTLDVGRGTLGKDGQDLNLRPQSFHVLLHLVERPGMLVSRQEILDAVWAGAVVTDDSLTQCITEVRRVIDDSMRTKIKTVPKRGFVFDVPVTRQSDVASIPSRQPGHGRRTVAGVAAVIAISIGVAWWATGLDKPGSPVSGEDETSMSIAVLPFADMSSEQDLQYFGEGIAEEILNQLAQLPNLRVIARTSSFAFKERDTAEIAAKLGVDYVLEGGVRRSGEKTRITAQLINAQSHTHVWSRAYDPILTVQNLIDVQNEIATLVAQTVGTSTNPQAGTSAFTPPPANSEALDHYLSGQFYLRQIETGIARDYESALSRFQDALAADPGWAPAYAALGRTQHFRASGNSEDRAYWYEESRRNLERAIELNPNYAPAYKSLAFVTHFHDMDFAKSERLYKKAFSLGGGSHWGYALLLNTIGRPAAAQEHFRAALAVDPLSRIVRGQYAGSLECSGHFNESLAQYRELRSAHADRPDYAVSMARIHLRLGQVEAGRRLFEQFAEPDKFPGRYGAIYAMLGMTEAAEAVLDYIDAGPRYRPTVYADTALLLGQRERAIVYIEAAAGANPRSLFTIQCKPATGALADEPRFRAALDKAGFPNRVTGGR